MQFLISTRIADGALCMIRSQGWRRWDECRAPYECIPTVGHRVPDVDTKCKEMWQENMKDMNCHLAEDKGSNEDYDRDTM